MTGSQYVYIDWFRIYQSVLACIIIVVNDIGYASASDSDDDYWGLRSP